MRRCGAEVVVAPLSSFKVVAGTGSPAVASRSDEQPRLQVAVLRTVARCSLAPHAQIEVSSKGSA